MGAMTIDISAALEIQGWMSESELRWLAEQASQHTAIVEIGSWKGRSTLALARNTSGVVWAVDHWQGQLLALDTTVDDEVRERGSDVLYREFRYNLKAEIKESRLKCMRMDSVRAAAKLSERPDMVFLDGEHMYEGVRSDINAWKQKLAHGGLLCGHDWWHEGVKRAVRELVPGFKVAEGTNIWWSNA